MTQTPTTSTSAAAAPAEAGLSDAIAAALPPDPYEQLEVARKITAVAVASRASRLEHEAARLRQKLADKDRLAADLADRAAALDQALRDADARLRAILDDNAKLVKERDSLAHTSKKLARDLAKLETFKRHLMQSLGDENSSSQETVDIRTCEQGNSWRSEGSANSHPVSTTTRADGSSQVESTNQDVARPFEQKLTITHITPRLVASDPAPRLRSSAEAPRRYSTAVSPKLTSGAASPRRYSTAVSPKLASSAAATSPRREGHMAMSAWLPSSKMSSAANSPPRGHSMSGRTTRVDGKEFFRQARSRLSYEQFAAFLANIKELNAHRQSQQETLEKADEIFGAGNKDLFVSFQGLLSRSLT
ncbi:uncharacterized protein At4g15545 [Brachypodium distachyon]|uniref:At4g15545-like C-terminal domain-containing protein n=1 Tax=Brachypodium distachyon TaxID=15368 RepID=A0A2K2DFA4_BRADI|nr:uncharacterized protein At4g15545 [Brachypodium distachyon]PNT72929.1 hypothetical protein BRADI_2g51060v3 [Brachypodium distachyon]|eukprot:XP_014754532.1 uncharacterized protein At4g15545 [Brachypodium distachyon]